MAKRLWQVTIDERPDRRGRGYTHNYVAMAEDAESAKVVAVAEHAPIELFRQRIESVTVEPWDGLTVKLGMRARRK